MKIGLVLISYIVYENIFPRGVKDMVFFIIPHELTLSNRFFFSFLFDSIVPKYLHFRIFCDQ